MLPMNKFFVLSNGDTPSKIVFDLESAFASNVLYIDVFDEQGNKVESYKQDEWSRDYVHC